MIERVIATGGFGTVYEVRHTVLDRAAALKVLHADLVSSGEAVLRFEREAKAVNQIRHRNVVDIYDFGELDNGQPYFVMELLRGDDLDIAVRSRGRMTPRELLDVIEPLAGALDEAHARGIIHRDVKASNVVIDHSGDAPRVVLLDFGVAKLLDYGSGITTTRHVVGSPACMAPEQITGAAVDARTDVYALGVLAFHLLTGSPPFESESQTVVQYQHLHAPRPRVSTRAGLSDELDAVVTKAMGIEPRERYAAAGELARALRGAVESFELDAMTPPEPTPGIAVYVSIHAPLDRPDDRLLIDISEAAPRAVEVLVNHGFSVAAEAECAAVLATPLPAGPAGSARRARAIAAARAAWEHLASRPKRDPRVQIQIVLRVVEARFDGERALGGGSLALDQMPPHAAAGVMASGDVVDGLELHADAGELPDTVRIV
jgi:serine/threonine-protein kinase